MSSDTTQQCFPRPPATLVDDEDRSITICHASRQHIPAIKAMYRDFDPAQRAQGIPPANPDRLDPWVETVMDNGIHLVCEYNDRVIGHAMLVPDQEGDHELAIFIHQDFQHAGNGYALLTHLLGAGIEGDVERVWLTVERWNRPAIELYTDVGFETVQAERFDLEMAMALSPRDEDTE